LSAAADSGFSVARCAIDQLVEEDIRPSFMGPPNRLLLVAVPPLQEACVGQLCHIGAQLETTLPVEVTIDFPERFFELVTTTRTRRVEPGTHTLAWTLYAKIAATDPVRLKIEARSVALYQLAEVIVRIADANS
jgi:hypothetical protein